MLDIASYIIGLEEGIKQGGGGGGISTETLNVTENGTYRADSGKAYTPVIVAVPQPEEYAGSYTVESEAAAAQTLQTAGKVMRENMVVSKISVAEVSNTAGGYTVTIGR